MYICEMNFCKVNLQYPVHFVHLTIFNIILYPKKS